MISPELSNPGTVLHVLKYKASLPCLIAMCLPECPRPVPVKWLCRFTGHSRDTIEQSLLYLSENLRLVFRDGIKRASNWWLADKVRQLPLPFTQYLRDGDTRPFPVTIDQQPDHRLPARGLSVELDRSTDPHDGSGQMPLLPTDGDADDYPIMPKISALLGSDEAIMPKISALSDDSTNARTHVRGDHVVVVDQHKDFSFSDQQQHGALMPKISALFLAWVPVDEPVPSQFADVDLAWPLSCYWFAVAAGFSNPAGYIRRRLEDELHPPKPWPDLAATWLTMTDEERGELLDAASESWRYQGHIQLRRDFPHFIPFREFRQLYTAVETESQLGPEWLIPKPPDD